MAAHNERRHPAKRARSCATRNPRPRGCSPLGTPKGWSRSKKAKKRRSAAFFFTLFHFSPIDPSGAKNRRKLRCRGAQCAPVQLNDSARFHGRTLFAPTTYPKNAIKNRNFASSSRRVLAPGRGQCVRSWILKGALAKRSRKARTQAPLSRASRAIGSSGHLFRFLFGCPKRKD